MSLDISTKLPTAISATGLNTSSRSRGIAFTICLTCTRSISNSTEIPTLLNGALSLVGPIPTVLTHTQGHTTS